MGKKLKLISSVCLGGYNDTMIYDTVIEYLGKKEHIGIEKFWDSSKEKDLWKIETELNLSYEMKKSIIEILSNDMPSIFSDKEPKKYNKDVLFKDHEKSIDDWKKSKATYITDYLHIGDKVSHSLIDYFVEALQPITINGEIVQIAGEYSTDSNGNPTYLTFAAETPFGDWIYKGACLKGETINQEYKFEEIEIANIDSELEEEKEI